MTGTELDPAKNDPVVAHHVDIVEVPSAAWGWSGESPKTFRRAGWVITVFLLLMIIGNHTGRVEDIWLVAFAALIAAILLRDIVTRRKER